MVHRKILGSNFFRTDHKMSRPQHYASRMFARLYSRYQRDAARSFARRPFTMKSDVPLISFTFDDFPRSALLRGGAILHSFGVAGTYYASLGLMGKDTPTGRIFSPDDLPVLQTQGHELGCHTYDHVHAWDTSPRAFEESVLRNREALGTLMPGLKFESLSYPIGVPRPQTKSRIAKYFACARCGGQRVNSGTIDLNYLAAFFLEQSRDNPEGVRAIIDRNRQERSWLIFATHDVCEDPTPYGCTPDYFKDVVRYAVESRAQILPVSRALKLMQSKSSS
jgi:hypothetical protein